jgi:excisionase family DNA binding protein
MTPANATAALTPDLLEEGAMGVPEAAEFTGLGRSDLYARMSRGELPFSKVGRRRLIPRRALKDLLRKNLTPAAE